MTSYLEGLLLCTVLVITFILDGMVASRHWHSVPEGTTAMCIGLLVGFFDFILGGNMNSLITLDVDLFKLVLVPPIIFQAGFTIKTGFFNNFGTILNYAFLGTFVNFFITGLCVHWYLGVNPIESYMLAALLSAVNPEPSMVMMSHQYKLKQRETAPLLYNLFAGSALFCDAVCVVLFAVLEPHLNEYPVSASAILGIIGVFFLSFFASAILGILVACITALVFKHANLEHDATAEIFVMMLMSYTSYFICQALGLSGLIAIFFCGITQAHYTWPNCSDFSRLFVPRLVTSVGYTAQLFVFAYLGMAVFAFMNSVPGQPNHDWDFGFIFFVLAVCLGARAVSVFLLTPLANLGRKKNKVDFKSQLAMWFCGQRGAITFALGISMTDMTFDGVVGAGTPHSSKFLTTTLVVVILSNVVMGSLTLPFFRCIGMADIPPQAKHRSKKSQRWHDIDDKYLKPILLAHWAPRLSAQDNAGLLDPSLSTPLVSDTDYVAMNDQL